jgi:hypothetical protein
MLGRQQPSAASYFGMLAYRLEIRLNLTEER